MARNDDLRDRRKRFYKTATVAREEGGGFSVRLDGRIPRSPGGKPLVLPTARLAELCTQEWAAQGDAIDAASMPATRMAFTVIDGAAEARAGLADQVARFAETDLLLYFAETPSALVERQERRWGPVIEWAEAQFDVRFMRAQGIRHVVQPPQTLERIRAAAAAEGDYALTGLAFGAALLGSALLVLALRRGELSAMAAFDLSRLDETFQQEQWGVDAEAEASAERLAQDVVMLERWFQALG
ncbi:MAG: ATP12 family chaperone protein [Caulobacterales bacterium]